MTAYDDWGYPVSSSRNHFRDPPTVMQRIQQTARSLLQRAKIYNPNAPAGSAWNLRPIFSVPNLLTLVWLFFVYANERSAFRSSIEACEWSNWESWVCMSCPQSNAEASADRASSRMMPFPTASSSSPTRSLSTRTRTPAARGLCPP